MKKILYVTGSRAEYGIVRRLLTMLRETPEIQLDLAVTGMHCDCLLYTSDAADEL